MQSTAQKGSRYNVINNLFIDQYYAVEVTEGSQKDIHRTCRNYFEEKLHGMPTSISKQRAEELLLEMQAEALEESQDACVFVRWCAAEKLKKVNEAITMLTRFEEL